MKPFELRDFHINDAKRILGRDDIDETALRIAMTFRSAIRELGQMRMRAHGMQSVEIYRFEYELGEMVARMVADSLDVALIRELEGGYVENVKPPRIPLKGAWAIDGDGAIVLTDGEGRETGLVMANYGPGADHVEMRVSDLEPLTKSRAADLNRSYLSEGRLADNDGVYR